MHLCGDLPSLLDVVDLLLPLEPVFKEFYTVSILRMSLTLSFLLLGLAALSMRVLPAALELQMPHELKVILKGRDLQHPSLMHDSR
jgi:hypothetical protein